ncbi:MAG: M55 family metallopeptidase [Spirochaetes bacterium]|nr:M55 family metallopeptidase [Spirochaetota bacterium]
MKVYISFDFEGIAGVAFWRETDNDMKWNKLATEQLKAFINGIKNKNKDAEIIVSDSHSFGSSLLWEELDGVKLIRGWPRVYYMIEGIDDTFTDLVLFGYHTSPSENGMMGHTYSSSSFYTIKINEEIVDEARINSYFASEFNVPLSFIYGDKQTIETAPGYPDSIEYCISKDSISRFCGIMNPKNEILSLLYKKGEDLGKKRKIIYPKRNDKGEIYPLNCEIEFLDTARAKLASILPYVRLIEPRKIQFFSENMKHFYRTLNAISLICYSVNAIK